MVYDSLRVIEMMKKHGYTKASSPEDANLLIMNTCHIREKAAEKVFSELGKYRIIKTLIKEKAETPL